MNPRLYAAGGSHFAYANTNKTAIQRPAIQATVSLCRATREIVANLMPSNFNEVPGQGLNDRDE